MPKRKTTNVEVVRVAKEVPALDPADPESILRQVLDEELFRKERKIQEALEKDDMRGAQLALGGKQVCQEIKRQIQMRKRELAQAGPSANSGSLETWFRPKKISDEVRRLQTVVERRKWSAYFERYGCLRCRKTNRPHSGNGLCASCRLGIHTRLKAILKELEEESGR